MNEDRFESKNDEKMREKERKIRRERERKRKKKEFPILLIHFLLAVIIKPTKMGVKK